MKELQTKRLKLKNIDYDDADFMYKEFSTAAVNAYLFDAEPLSSFDEARKLIDFYVCEEAIDRHRWIMVRKDSSEKIGTCGFHRLDRMKRTVEIGYDIQPEHWRQGYASEALSGLIAYLWEELNVKTITAHIAEGNAASIKTAEKLGFVRTGDTYFERFHGDDFLHYIYELKQ